MAFDNPMTRYQASQLEDGGIPKKGLYTPKKRFAHFAGTPDLKNPSQMAFGDILKMLGDDAGLTDEEKEYKKLDDRISFRVSGIPQYENTSEDYSKSFQNAAKRRADVLNEANNLRVRKGNLEAGDIPIDYAKDSLLDKQSYLDRFLHKNLATEMDNNEYLDVLESLRQDVESEKNNYEGENTDNYNYRSIRRQEMENDWDPRRGRSPYQDGGIHKGTKYAQNGDLMFDSTGDSAVVGGDSYADDRVDARLNSGEAVLNVAQQQRLMDILRGKEDLTALGDEDIVEGVPSDYQEELKDKVDNGKDLKMEGLKKLLSALGEG
jgi:hypothetical protein